jgi:hypothetical protein
VTSPPSRGIPPEIWKRAMIRNLGQRFPQVIVWYGSHTHSWWAMSPAGLLEAPTAEALAALLGQRP